MDAVLPPVTMPVSPGGDPTALAAQAKAKDARANAAAAQGFESMFATLLVKQMRQTLEPDTLFGTDRGEVLGGLFDFFLGQHLAQSGALGIGAIVKKQLDARKKS